MISKIKLGLVALAVAVAQFSCASPVYAYAVPQPVVPSISSTQCYVALTSDKIANRNNISTAGIRGNGVIVQILGADPIYVIFNSEEAAKAWMTKVFPKLPCLQ